MIRLSLSPNQTYIVVEEDAEKRSPKVLSFKTNERGWVSDIVWVEQASAAGVRLMNEAGVDSRLEQPIET